MITHIKTNFRGYDRDLEKLKPITIFHGDNGVGKTTLMDAVTACCIGHVPKLGKSNQKLGMLIGFSGVAYAEIRVEGSKKPRTFELRRDESGSIAKKVSHKDALSSSCFDSRAFLLAGPTERVKIIQSYSSGEASADPIKTLTKALETHLGKYTTSEVVSPSKDLGEWCSSTRANIMDAISKQRAKVAQYASSVLTEDERESFYVPTYNPEHHRKVYEKVSFLQGERGACEGRIKYAMGRIDDLQETLNSINQEELNAINPEEIAKSLTKINEKAMLIKGEILELEKADAIEPCKECGATHIHWRTKTPELSKNRSQIKDKQRSIHELEAQEQELLDSLQQARGERPESIKSQIEELLSEVKSSEEKAAQIEADLVNARAELDESVQAQHKDMEERTRQNSRDAAVNAKAEAEKSLECFVCAQKEFDLQVSEMSHQIMEPILRVGNAILEGILPHTMVHDDFNIGYMKEDVWVPLESFSGSECEAALIGISAGLAACADGFKMAIMDESGTMKPARFYRLIENLRTAIVDGILDQVFITGTQDYPYDADAVKVIELA